MTVAQLIEKLEEYPDQDTIVVFADAEFPDEWQEVSLVAERETYCWLKGHNQAHIAK